MTKKVYLVRKDPLGPPTEDNWIRMSGKEFHDCQKRGGFKKRYFIRMGDDFHEDSDTIYIEANKEQYDEWRREYDRHRYLAKQERNSCICSIDQIEEEDQIIDTICSGATDDPEEVQITKELRIRFRKVVNNLTEMERELLGTVLSGKAFSIKEMAQLYGMSCEALRKKKSRLLSRMRRP